MAKTVPLDQVPASFEAEKPVIVCNPLEVDFVCQYAGKDVVVGAGKMVTMPENKAAHVAKHLANFILNNRSVQFLQEKFPGLTEDGKVKWQMAKVGTFTREDLVELAKTFLVYDYEIGEEKPKMPKIKTKFDDVTGKEKNGDKEKPGDEDKPSEDVEANRGHEDGPADEKEGTDEDEEEDESSEAAKKPAKKAKK